MKYKERASLGTPPYIGKRGYFDVGKSLSASLFERINSIYQTAVQIKDSDLSAGNYDRVIKFSIQRDKCGLNSPPTNPDIDFEDIPGEGYQTRSARFNIFVSIEVFDGEGLEVITSKVVRGDGIYRTERKVRFSSDDPHSSRFLGLDRRKNRLEKAINDAIQDVSNKAAKLLKSGFLKSNN